MHLGFSLYSTKVAQQSGQEVDRQHRVMVKSVYSGAALPMHDHDLTY